MVARDANEWVVGGLLFLKSTFITWMGSPGLRKHEPHALWSEIVIKQQSRLCGGDEYILIKAHRFGLKETTKKKSLRLS